MKNLLELTPEEARFLDHVLHEGCSHSPPIARKLLVDLGVYEGGWDVSCLETIRSRELGTLVSERPSFPVVCPWKTLEDVRARELEARKALGL